VTKATAKEKSQLDKFKEAAREHETDDSEKGFERVLRKVAQPTEPSVGSKRKGPVKT
jgi:hypothetical protein